MSYHVYFIRAGHDGSIKIGVAGNIPERLRDLQVASWKELRLIEDMCCVSRESALALEGDLHQRLRKSRIRGEWYEATPEVMAAIRDPDPEGDEIETPFWADDIDRKNLSTLAPAYRRRIIATATRRWGGKKRQEP